LLRKLDEIPYWREQKENDPCGSAPIEKDMESLPLLKRTPPPSPSAIPATSGTIHDKTLNPVKEGELSVYWDPRDWNVRFIDTKSSYYHFHHSYDYPPRWGVTRVPAISKINSPFNKQNPLILFPGRIVYTILHQNDSDAHYYVFMEGHIHDKKAKKSAQMLVYIPEQCRPTVSSTAPPDVQLGACFQVLNLNHIDPSTYLSLVQILFLVLGNSTTRCRNSCGT
jgi:hypothetical protein